MSYQIGTATDVNDLLLQLDAFLRKGHTLDPQYSGTGTGTIANLIGTATSVLETITVTLTSATAFSVNGTVSGALGTGTVGTPFTCSVCSFTLVTGGVAWVSGDTITFTITPPWVQKRGPGLVVATLTDKFTAYSAPDHMTTLTDNSTSTWSSVASASLPAYLGMQLSQAVEIRAFKLTNYLTSGYGPTAFKLQYSDDNATWTDAQTYATTWSGVGITQTFTVTAAPGAHTYWRLYVTAASSWSDISGWSLFTDTAATQQVNIGPFSEYVWQAPGNGAAQQIYVGLFRFTDPTGDYDNLRTVGLTGYTPGVAWSAQPGFPNYAPVMPLLRSGSMPYWFVANGQRVVVVCKCSTVYESLYLGYVNSYLPPGNYPYPLVMGGSMSWASGEPSSTSTSWRWSYQGEAHRNFAVANYGGSAYSDPNYYQLRLRLTSGSWRGFQFGDGWGATSSGLGYIWPLMSNCANDMRANLDGTYPLLPIVLSDMDSSGSNAEFMPGNPNTYGELDGVFFTPGYGNAAENTIMPSSRITHAVFQNVYRTTKIDYWALKLA